MISSQELAFKLGSFPSGYMQDFEFWKRRLKVEAQGGMFYPEKESEETSLERCCKMILTQVSYFPGETYLIKWRLPRQKDRFLLACLRNRFQRKHNATAQMKKMGSNVGIDVSPPLRGTQAHAQTNR